ncbi:type III-A CRISPR-associated RAMP protein Csm5 [Thermococcus indicus]|uniref:CRISPR system Cms protein Csm5 n=1 Tax=Thermococcus indicus TaxID=2586643 RepID=A0A4Y5SK59_9EURY|nr:type III-A CRISPR-associated RAMP protein Csm5 [Thermococcus indicus]QDA31337.1 type III-A CRISPR-associated RAMP protein Csm5 [Thermococcus indicus]
MMLRVLSPLHIGNGNELTPLDLYPGDGVVYVLDTEKLMKKLTDMGVSLEEILYLLKNPSGDSYIWKGYIDELGLDVREYSLYSLPVRGEVGKRSMTVKEFMKVNGRPYIPGSSLKGALRTAILYKVLRECGDSGTAMKVVLRTDRRLAEKIGWSGSLAEFYVDYLLEELRKAESQRRYRFEAKKADDLLEAIVFGMETDRRGVKYEPKRDPLRALIVRDSPPVGRRHLALYRVDVIGNPQPIPIWVEALEPGTALNVEINVNAETLRLNAGHFNGLLWECLKDLGEPWKVFEGFLWEAVDEFHGELVRTELEGVRRYGRNAEKVKAFYASIQGYGGRILRLGWGSGWLAMTIGLLLGKERKWESLRKKLGLGKKPRGRGLSREFPKTRRLADGKPMGWVMLG